MGSEITDYVTKDGSSGYKAETGRYHLYVSFGCPFAHRCLIARTLKGLEDVITVDNVDFLLNRAVGWKFSPEKEGCTKDTVNSKEYLKEVYELSHPGYGGRVSVPVLFDKQTKKIVSNDSAAILRMLNSEFNEFCATPEQAAVDLYPSDQQKEIDALNDWITPEVVSGVYKVKGALQTSQEKYEEEVGKLFSGLDKIEEILSKKRFLTGVKLTEADVRLFVALIRFDSVYYRLFLCSRKPLVMYKNIWPYIRDVYQTGGIGSTVDIKQIKSLYYLSYLAATPSAPQILPVGPDLDFNEPAGR